MRDGSGNQRGRARPATTDQQRDGARPVKHSLSIKGHRTSISLERAFWAALVEAAAHENVAMAELVGKIDASRGDAGLSSAIRVWLLDYHRREPGQG